MKIKKLTVAVSAALVVAYLPAHGEDEGLGGGPEIKLRGFGTIGVVRSTNSKADVMDNLSQPRGAGHSHKWDFGVDSKLAVQADAKFNDRLSASWQVMSQRQADDTYRPHTEMAFAKLQATSDVNIRLGRIPAPLFMVSEYRKVGYVNPWVRQPNEVYFQVPYNSVDGGDVSYQFNKGDFTGNFQVAAGSMTAVGIPSEGYINTLKGHHGLSFNFIGEYGPVTFRIGHSRTKNQYTGESLSSLYDGLKNIALNGNGSCHGSSGVPLTASAATAAYGQGNCPGVAQSIFQRSYSAAYQGSTTAQQLDASLKQVTDAVQSANPNMEYESARNYVLTSDNPSFKALQDAYKQVTQGVTNAAASVAAGYNGLVASSQGQILSDSSLKSRAGELYDEYNSDKETGTFTGVGVIVDTGDWLLQSEYTIRKVESFLADTTGWYITAGRRFGRVMPYVSLSELKVDSPKTAPYLLTASEQNALATFAKAGGVAPVPYGLLNSISTGVDKTVQGTSYGQKNVSLGVRWDFLKSAAIKFQWDRIDTEKYARGTMQNYVHTDAAGNTVLSALGTEVVIPSIIPTASTDPNTPPAPPASAILKTEFDRTKPVNVFSLAVDFVF